MSPVFTMRNCQIASPADTQWPRHGQTIAPSLRCADHDEQSDGTGDQRIRQQVEAVGRRNGGAPATEQRVHLPDRSPRRRSRP